MRDQGGLIFDARSLRGLESAEQLAPVLAAVRDWLSGIAPRPQALFLPGVGHFFHGRLNELKSALHGFVPQHML